MNNPLTEKYREGYQDALSDIRVEHAQRGLEGALLWLARELKDPRERALARMALTKFYAEDPDRTQPLDVASAHADEAFGDGASQRVSAPPPTFTEEQRAKARAHPDHQSRE